MSGTLQTQVVREEQIAPVLVWLQSIRAGHAAVVALFAVVFLYFNYLPLWHTDLWGHVAQGRWILDHGRLPSQDPFQPLAVGVPLLDYAWLSQILLAEVYARWSAEGLQNLFSLVVLASCLLLTRTYYLLAQRLDVAILGWFVATFVVGWSRHAIMRPEVFAVFLFFALLYLIATVQKRFPSWTLSSTETESVGASVPWQMYLGVPIVFALWVNIHGSFPCGVLLMACFGFARVVEVLWYQRSFARLWSDLWIRRWLLWGQLALVGLLANPYGVDALLFSLSFPGRENLATVLEWQPISFWRTERDTSFIPFSTVCLMFSWIVLAVVAWNSRRRWNVAEVVLIAVFMLIVFPQIRMLAWYPAVLLFVLMPHMADIANRWYPQRDNLLETPEEPEEDSPLKVIRPYQYALMCAALIWIAFGFSSIGNLLLGGKPRPEEVCYSRYTPFEVTEYLRKHPPEEQIFNPQVWGDWLVWAGPENLPVMTTTNIHLTPPRVWRDYLGICMASPGWERALQRYGIELVIIDPQTMPRLAEVIQRDEDWELIFEAESQYGGAIYRRATHGAVANSTGQVVAAQTSTKQQD